MQQPRTRRRSPSSARRSMVISTTRRWRVTFALAGTACLLAGTLLALGSADAAASAAYAVTEVPNSTATYEVAADPHDNTVYAVTSFGLDVINGATNTITAHITTTLPPDAVAVDPVSDTVYAIPANGAADVIDGKTNTVTATISLSNVSPANAAADPGTGLVYVTNQLHHTVAVINGQTDTSSTITLAAAAELSPSPDGVAVDTANDMVYVSDSRDNLVAVIDGMTNAVTSRIALPAGSAPAGVAVDPALGHVFVADQGSGAISVIDTATESVSTLASGMTQPNGLALDTGTGTLYATSSSGSAGGLGTTYAIDTDSGVIGAQIPRGGQSATVMPGSSASAYVGFSPGALGAYVTVIKPSTATTMSPVIVSSLPEYPTFTVGEPVHDQLAADALPPATFSATELPAGVTLSPSGLLSGTPAVGTGGLYYPVITAANGVAPPSTSQPVALTVDEAPAITSGNQATFYTGFQGEEFSVTARGFPTPAISESGALPAGLTLTSGGVLSGTPAPGTEGRYPITITATIFPATVTQAFTLTVSRSPLTVGAEGSDGQLWVQAPQLSAGWHPLGGKLTAPPAVTATPVIGGVGSTPAPPLFIGTGTDKHLYIRSLSVGWRLLGPRVASCIGGPAAVITGTSTSGYTLTVACRGTDNALWDNSTALPASGLPQFSSGWTRLGGVLTAGPAVAQVGGVTTFFVRGTTGHIYIRTLTTGFAEQPWSCIGAPAASLRTATTTTYIAWQGTDHALWYASNSGSRWTSASSLGGTLIGNPAVAADYDQIVILAEGTTHAVYQYALFGASPGWHSLGGYVGGSGGVGAADLT